MTYNNSELFPKIKPLAPPNKYIDTVIAGYGNIIERSSRNTTVNGDGNYVGEETSNINIFNSSGCIISSGVIGSTLINCSGITVYDDNLVYINNQLFKLGGSISSGAYKKITTSYAILTTDETIDFQGTGAGLFTVLPTPVGNNKRYTIKNNSTTFDDFKVIIYGYDIDNTQVSGAGEVILPYLDSVTVMSDGIDNYLII